MRVAFWVVALVALSAVGCDKKKDAGAQPAQAAGAPSGITIPLPQPPPPQGSPSAPHVGASECNYSIDKQINFYTKRDPTLKANLAAGRQFALAQCLEKWTHDEYDCVVKAKTLEELVVCKRFERP